MGILISSLTLVAAAALIGWLVRRGFRDGDRPGDVRVSLVSRRTSQAGPGGWIEVEIANPGPTTALVGLALDARAPAPPRPARAPGRRPQRLG